MNSYAYNEELMLAGIAKFRAEERARAQKAAPPIVEAPAPQKLPPQPAVAAQKPATRNVLRSAPASRRGISAIAIASMVAENFGLAVADLHGRNRAYRIARPRQLAMLLMRECAGMSLGEIGLLFHMHHTTVVHGMQVAAARCLVDKKLMSVRDRIRSHARAVAEGRIAAMTANDLAAACPTCAAQPGFGCVSTDGTNTPVPYIHAARIEASAFVLGIQQPGETRPITDREIDATGLV